MSSTKLISCLSSGFSSKKRDIQQELTNGADPNRLGMLGVSAMHLACGQGFEAAQLMLQYGGDPNILSLDGITPLHVAASWGDWKTLELLLKNGANINIQDQDGKTAYSLALDEGHLQCAEILKHHSVMHTIRDDRASPRYTVEERNTNSSNACTDYDHLHAPHSPRRRHMSCLLDNSTAEPEALSGIYSDTITKRMYQYLESGRPVFFDATSPDTPVVGLKSHCAAECSCGACIYPQHSPTSSPHSCHRGQYSCSDVGSYRDGCISRNCTTSPTAVSRECSRSSSPVSIIHSHHPHQPHFTTSPRAVSRECSRSSSPLSIIHSHHPHQPPFTTSPRTVSGEYSHSRSPISIIRSRYPPCMHENTAMRYLSPTYRSPTHYNHQPHTHCGSPHLYPVPNGIPSHYRCSNSLTSDNTFSSVNHDSPHLPSPIHSCGNMKLPSKFRKEFSVSPSNIEGLDGSLDNISGPTRKHNQDYCPSPALQKDKNYRKTCKSGTSDGDDSDATVLWEPEAHHPCSDPQESNQQQCLAGDQTNEKPSPNASTCRSSSEDSASTFLFGNTNRLYLDSESDVGKDRESFWRPKLFPPLQYSNSTEPVSVRKSFRQVSGGKLLSTGRSSSLPKSKTTPQERVAEFILSAQNFSSKCKVEDNEKTVLDSLSPAQIDEKSCRNYSETNDNNQPHVLQNKQPELNTYKADTSDSSLDTFATCDDGYDEAPAHETVRVQEENKSCEVNVLDNIHTSLSKWQPPTHRLADDDIMTSDDSFIQKARSPRIYRMKMRTKPLDHTSVRTKQGNKEVKQNVFFSGDAATSDEFQKSKLPKDVTENIATLPVPRECKNKRLSDLSIFSSVSVKEYVYKDKERGITLIERHIPSDCGSSVGRRSLDSTSSKATVDSQATVIYDWRNCTASDDDDTQKCEEVSIPDHLSQMTCQQISQELQKYGEIPGPVTPATRQAYLRRLTSLESNPGMVAVSRTCPDYHAELRQALNGKFDASGLTELETKLVEVFSSSSNGRQWREGTVKSSFTYLLLDPRVTDNLPLRSKDMTDVEIFKTFICSIFYIGKGKRARPYSHLYEAVTSMSKASAKIMFPDSEVARKMTLGRTKVGYLIRHGLGPHFAQLLKERVKKESCFTLLFDESLNDSLQKKQLDVDIRIWENNQVCTLYLSSIFMGHASACDLLGQLLPICQEYGAHKLVQISMDGPNVNWKLHRDLQLVLAKETGKQLLNVGSCGLHIIHNSFRAGHGASKWEVDDFLSSLHYLFNESPARREDFSAITGSHVFPLPFCKHRWLENVKVAQRALAMWPFVVQYVKSVREDKAKLPQNKSFKVIEECVKDALLLPKLHSYVSVAEIVLPFLTRYQDDKPMLPFLADDLSSVVKDLLQRVAKPSVMEGLSSSYQVANLNLDDKAIFKNIMKMDLGYVAERAIKESNMGELSVRELKTQFKDFVITMLKKILLKSPISYSLCRALDCLDPGKLENEKTLGHFSTVLQKLEEAGHISAADVDKTKAQYQKARETLRRQQMPFSRTHDRLDNYWHNAIGHDTELQDLWRVVRLLLTMSHGQAAVERGFSVNKEIMTENKSEDTLIAQRLIYSHISRVGGIENVQMNQSIMSAARSAKAKYMEHLEEEKKRKESEQTSRKRKEREGELNTLRENVKRLKTIHVALVDDADSYALKAEAKSDFALLSKSNAFRSAAANKEELEKAEKELRDKELEFSSNP